MKLRFLGTGASVGVPAFYCNCVACEEAMQDGKLARTRASLLLQGRSNYLVDASPDLRTQLLNAGVRQIDGVLLTHTHFDHSAGLGELESYVRLIQQKPLPAWMTADSKLTVLTQNGHLTDCLDFCRWEAGSQIELEELRCQALEVSHSEGAIGMLLVSSENGRRVAYLPDTGPLPLATQQAIAGVDVLILGATFWRDNWMPDTHLSVEQAVEIALELNVHKLYLTHLAMHYQPVTARELRAYLSSRGTHLELAYDGLEFDI